MSATTNPLYLLLEAAALQATPHVLLAKQQRGVPTPTDWMVVENGLNAATFPANEHLLWRVSFLSFLRLSNTAPMLNTNSQQNLDERSQPLQRLACKDDGLREEDSGEDELEVDELESDQEDSEKPQPTVDRSYKGKGPHKCSLCGAGVMRKSDLRRHERTHLPKTQWKHRCRYPDCDVADTQAENVKIHQRAHVPDKGKSPNLCRHFWIRPDGTIRKCIFATRTRSYRTRHENRAHPKPNNHKLKCFDEVVLASRMPELVLQKELQVKKPKSMEPLEWQVPVKQLPKKGKSIVLLARKMEC
ncbi:hypothetical protein PHLCEN_2v12925 [Hermanssonia centrifuga]|uniref:C2H2-type domain-containing protein n=1 Tax=Hermanssonia centrifuga TaxID=98765 RepID=A0A2R6NFP6_9APHY|nr:hypothetical protein PHLCEN_2v12925 [Hermanssonia centrifuga]